MPHYGTRGLGGSRDTLSMRKAVETDRSIQTITQITITTEFWNIKYAIKLPNRQIGVLIYRLRKVTSGLPGTETRALSIIPSILENRIHNIWFVGSNEQGGSKNLVWAFYWDNKCSSKPKRFYKESRFQQASLWNFNWSLFLVKQHIWAAIGLFHSDSADFLGCTYTCIRNTI